jgi:uncharacterized protein
MENQLKERVLVTGGNGLIGQYLSGYLKTAGYEVSILGRSAGRSTDYAYYTWDIDKGEMETEALLNVGYIIHLAGANIGERRWTKKRKQEIIDSRVKSAKLLFMKIKESNFKPKAIISASAIGYYGAVTSDRIFEENDLPGNDFLGTTCKQWEESVDQFEELGIRTVKIRTGLVLTREGGALAKMILPVKLGIGSPLGNGRQYMPWIHIDDLCRMYLKAIEDNGMAGVFNAVAPEHINNKEFTRSLCVAVNRPFWAPNIPAFLLKITLGEMADILLKGSRISCAKLRETGFIFKYPDLQVAFNNLLRS